MRGASCACRFGHRRMRTKCIDALPICVAYFFFGAWGSLNRPSSARSIADLDAVCAWRAGICVCAGHLRHDDEYFGWLGIGFVCGASIRPREVARSRRTQFTLSFHHKSALALACLSLLTW